jgi:hypothetical protein
MMHILIGSFAAGIELPKLLGLTGLVLSTHNVGSTAVRAASRASITLIASSASLE